MTTTTVTISSRFQVTLPKTICELLDLEPGQELQAIPMDDRIVLIPVRKLEQMRGFLRGIDATIER